MPPGVPVATVAIGKAGAKNAAILAVQILALADAALRDKLLQFKKSRSRRSARKTPAQPTARLELATTGLQNRCLRSSVKHRQVK